MFSGLKIGCFPKSRLLLPALLLLFGSGAYAEGIRVDEDLFLGIWSPYARSFQKQVPVCIWSENQELFRLEAAGQSGSRAFQISNSLGHGVRYDVFLHDGERYRRREKLRQNRPSRRIISAQPSRYCADGPSAYIRIKLHKGQIDAAIPAIYTDTLYLTLSPL